MKPRSPLSYRTRPKREKAAAINNTIERYLANAKAHQLGQLIDVCHAAGRGCARDRRPAPKGGRQA